MIVNSNETPEFLKSKRNPVYFIAEIGGNHEGSYDQALRQLSLALEAGVDAVKFQILRGDTLVSPVEGYERNKHFKRFELEREHFESLAKICADNDTDFVASVWDEASLAWVNPLVPFHKVGSGDLTAFPLLRELVNTGKPILLSTGLSTMKEIRRTVEFIAKCDSSYLDNNNLVLMQCTSSYPNPDSDANLRVVQTLSLEFGLPVGYSDHTFGLEAAYLAVFCGAQVLEVHFTDQREGRTFRDHQISATSIEVLELMQRLRRAETLLGSAEKIVTPSELESGHVKSFRRAIYANRSLEAGQKLMPEDLIILRPENGIPAWKYDDIIGKAINKSLNKFDAIREEDIG